MSLSIRNSYMWKINIAEPLYLTFFKNTFGPVCMFICLFIYKFICYECILKD